MNHSEEQETQTWLAILSGETVTGADPSMVLEAEALRAVLQCRLHPPQLNPNLLNNVIVQLQKEGLIKATWRERWRELLQKVTRIIFPTPQLSWQWRIGLSFAFAVFIAVIILPPFLKSPAPELTGRSPTNLRSCTVLDANPQARATLLQTELNRIGVKTTLKSSEPTWRIDVDVTNLSSSNAAKLEELLNKQNCQGGWTAGNTLRAIIIKPGNN